MTLEKTAFFFLPLRYSVTHNFLDMGVLQWLNLQEGPKTVLLRHVLYSYGHGHGLLIFWAIFAGLIFI